MLCMMMSVCLCVNVCSEILGLFSPWISGYAFSSTLAFSLRLMPLRLAVDATPSFQAPSNQGIVRQLERGEEDQRKFEIMCR
jgi:hypothetical protein